MTSNHATSPILKYFIKYKWSDCNSGVCGRIWMCEYIFCIYRISGIQIRGCCVQQNAAMRTRTHFKTQSVSLCLGSNLGSIPPPFLPNFPITQCPLSPPIPPKNPNPSTPQPNPSIPHSFLQYFQIMSTLSQS